MSFSSRIVVGLSLVCCISCLPALGDSAVGLPAPFSLHGLQVQITSAGFGSPALVVKDNSAQFHPESGFYFSYEASQLGKPLSEEQLKSSISFTGLFDPQGAPIDPTAFLGQNCFFANVAPDWKSVRAEFEVHDPQSLAQDIGYERTARELQEIALPEIGASVQPDNVEFHTAHGTRIRLAKVTRSHWPGSGREEHPKKSMLVASFEVEEPKDAPGAKIVIENARASYGMESESGRVAWENGGVEVHSLNVPENATTVRYAFDLVESDRSWRKVGAFQRVSFEVPVAALWKKAPLQVQVPFTPSVSRGNADFEARWDAGYDIWRGMSSEYTTLASRLWMRDVQPHSALGAWTPRKVEVVDGDKTDSLFSWASPPDGIFHADNTLAARTEIGYPLRRSTYERSALYADVKVTAQRAKTFITTHVLKNVPLPSVNQMREYGPQEFFDGVWTLRRAVWVDDPRLKDKIELSGGAGLLLTFERNPKTFFPEDGMQLIGKDVFYDQKGVLDPSGSTFQDGDPVLPGHDKDRVTLILSAPPLGTTLFSGNFRVRQQIWSGPQKELVLPHVGIGVRPGVTTPPVASNP